MNTFDINQIEFLNSYWKIFQNTTNSSIESFKSKVIKLFVYTNEISTENLEKFIDSVNAEDKIEEIEKEIDKYQKEINTLQSKINKIQNKKSEYEAKLIENICKKSKSTETTHLYVDPCSSSSLHADPCSSSGSFIGGRGVC